jgi:hypothetical protein
VHLGTGEFEAAIDCLEKAVDERNALAWWVGWSPLSDPLRSSPRFQRLLERIAPE